MSCLDVSYQLSVSDNQFNSVFILWSDNLQVKSLDRALADRTSSDAFKIQILMSSPSLESVDVVQADVVVERDTDGKSKVKVFKEYCIIETA